MTSKRARRQRKKAAAITLAGQPPIPQPVRAGRRSDLEAARSAHETALSARARHLGRPSTDEGLKAVSGPEYGCAVGAAIMADQIDAGQQSDLWQAVCHIRRVWLAYDRAVGAPSRHAKCLRILAPTEAMEATASSPAPDMRSPEDRERQAVAAWMALRGWMAHADHAAQSAAIAHIVDVVEAPLRDYQAVKRALLCVVEGIKGLPIKCRSTATA